MERMSQLSFLTMLYIMVLKIEWDLALWSWWWRYQKARALDMEIIEKCLVNEISTEKVKNIYRIHRTKILITKNINGFGVVVILCLWSEFCK
jgi:hypothetical protein